MNGIDTDEFHDQVRAAVAEIGKHLPTLAQGRSALSVLAAMSEHVGGGLRLCKEAGACTADDVRTVLRQLETIVFARE